MIWPTRNSISLMLSGMLLRFSEAAFFSGSLALGFPAICSRRAFLALELFHVVGELDGQPGRLLGPEGDVRFAVLVLASRRREAGK